MTVDEFRQLHSRILLTSTGRVPPAPLTLAPCERQMAFERLARGWRLLEHAAGASCSRDQIPDLPTRTETWDGMRRWFLGHHAFIPLMAINGYCLEAVADASDAGRPDEARSWAALASRLRVGPGALIRYGIDFLPCTSIYGSAIRSGMPEAFSGFWIRERQFGFQPAHVRFCRAFPPQHPDRAVVRLRADMDAAHHRYHALHAEVMRLAVPDGQSLAAEYHRIHGRMHEIADAEFDAYDAWFCIERRSELTRLEYLLQTCDVLERLVADLLAGSRLERSVVAEILSGLTAAFIVFGGWVAALPWSPVRGLPVTSTTRRPPSMAVSRRCSYPAIRLGFAMKVSFVMHPCPALLDECGMPYGPIRTNFFPQPQLTLASAIDAGRYDVELL